MTLTMISFQNFEIKKLRKGRETSPKKVEFTLEKQNKAPPYFDENLTKFVGKITNIDPHK
jgi:hypothetical protein